MRYETILFTRGVSQNEDYHWCSYPKYLHIEQFHNYITPLLDYMRKSKMDMMEQWMNSFFFILWQGSAVIIRMYISDKQDCYGRNIFVIEGVACQEKNINFFFKDIFSIISFFRNKETTLQEDYHQKILNETVKIVDSGKQEQKEDYDDGDRKVMDFISKQKVPCNMLVGNVISYDDPIVQKYGFANIDDTMQRNFPQTVKIKDIPKVQFTTYICGNIDKKKKYSYCLEAQIEGADMDAISVVLTTEEIFPKDYLLTENLYAEEHLLIHILKMQYGEA